MAETTYVTGIRRQCSLTAPDRASESPDRSVPSRRCGRTGGTMPSSPTSSCHSSRLISSIDHARVELAIRDLKEGAGLEHCPSGKFFANAAWLTCAVLAHNLVRWTVRLGHMAPEDQLTVARTVRSRVLALPGRLVNRSGRLVLRLPERWPWATSFADALDRIRSLPQLA